MVALLMSVATEALQLGMVHRDPSVADVVSNVAGALVGIGCAVAWRIGTASAKLDRRRALGVALLGLFVVGRTWADAGPPLNSRGVTEPGTLEAYWRLDEDSGRIARDSSGHGLDAEFPRDPTRFPGISGRAPRFNGTSDVYADARRATAFRLIGSMTIAAWINAASFPVDDAVIVSTLEHIQDVGFGWQLDTTVDRGPQVIGFKLAGECGALMSRYGATPLQSNAWYHVAAVYDAASRTMHVYLNGKLDDGDLVGTVEDYHRSSRRGVLIGKRGDLSGFEFSRMINDVRLYSSALAPNDVAGLTRPARQHLCGYRDVLSRRRRCRHSISGRSRSQA
jgi:hypothetical protein